MNRLGKTRHIHFIGIGGIGMSGIAELLINLGYEVSGSDLKQSAATRRLAAMGAKVSQGHNRENTAGADVVVYSSAVSDTNPEIIAARDLAIPVIPRAEMLSELMRLKFGVAVAGAHGKTTTTSMVASVLTAGGLDPTVVIGGRLDIWGGSNAKLGQGDILVAEADESDGSFMALSPAISVVTNIDLEHIDHYGTMDNLRDTFAAFINKVPFYGTSILCLDNEEIQGIIPRLKKRYLTYGMSSQADLRAGDLKKDVRQSSFEALYKGRSMGRVTLGIPGEHNVLNSLAAIGVGLELDIPMEVISEGLKNLGGVARRFQIKGEAAGILVIDDYGHHPTEIIATLKTARECWPDRRLVVAFQPHRYTRTKSLYERFVLTFNEADVLLLDKIYGAHEEPIEGVSSDSLAQGVKMHGHKDVRSFEGREGLFSHLRVTVKKGDVVMTLGAGDIYEVGERLLEEMKRDK
ncbi:MAG: UDP-N-acetylmuramate--L-alanine ligase [Deltaproteobacteria bacterium CG_4_8_14_3_um_filter_51_11]|nr:UDP-N-acetylmuramate--L-alanine ligase [bacterium]OIP43707.1 MAG: UDP-N-acetylmuramate--L-alanine ligase [Desulfobacteraceae bacterium CG2_30_51_40]PIP48147.1 MAG: UDP-N-acetylmuramate--L-alanine ligase [Deltaproteobacteria bacterium CG23_combo_of_CG06-09_8_20_14_all_51_20]PIW01176.1 MAG: UDP-N-acetylmuramate--L-alanine ligase [Deltaproteobacteria bacterium CG17_big_fil_post_rev_8_21_14_2_50_51_6]PIX19439.1 MAG: UDP-N-acetylmuramate--L-alanine ligase [Deltaproteobacteria bacterium CG_4_8_14_